MPGRGNRYGGPHLAWRAAVLAQHPLCVMCLEEGRTRVSTVAHHVLPSESHPEHRYDVENGVGLCKTHHDGAAQSYERTGVMRGCDETGRPHARPGW